MNKKIVIVFLLIVVLITGCGNNQRDGKDKFEENEKIITLKENMSNDEMEDYFLSTIEMKKFYYGEVTHHIGATINHNDYKINMYNAFVFYDKENMNVYVINTDRNEKHIEEISEKKLMDYSIEDIINDSNLKYDLCTIDSFKIDYYREENESINRLYLQVKGKPNNDGNSCTFELYENDFFFNNGSMFSYYLFNNYGDAYDYVSTTYNNLNKSVKKAKPEIGMTASEVKSTSWGSPDKVNRTETSNGVYEQWVYRKRGYVYLDNGIVTSISDSY